MLRRCLGVFFLRGAVIQVVRVSACTFSIVNLCSVLRAAFSVKKHLESFGATLKIETWSCIFSLRRMLGNEDGSFASFSLTGCGGSDPFE